MQSILQLTVIGKVFKPNKGKVLSLNRTLDHYIECVPWYISFKPTSKQKLHKDAYNKAKERSELKTALLQSVRDKAVQIYKSFKNVKKKGSHLHLRKCCIRFDALSFIFVKADKKIFSYWLHLSLSGSYGRTAFPIIFGERKELIEEALHGEYATKSVEMEKKEGKWYAHFNLSREVAVPDSPEAVIDIDCGEKNFAVAVAIQKDSPKNP